MDRPNLSCDVLRRPDQVAEFWDWLTHRPRGYIAVDVETGNHDLSLKNGALQWYTPGFHVRMVQFGDAEGGWAIPYLGWQELVAGVFDWLNANRITQVWHNGFTFDYKALQTHGIKLDYSLLQDTFVYEGLLGYAGESRELKPTAEHRLGSWAGMGATALKEGMKNGGWDWSTVPMDWMPYPMYGVLDTCITALLYEAIEPERRLVSHLHDMEIATARLTNLMSINGMRTDGPYLKKQIARFRARATELDEIISKLGVDNPNSSDQIRKILSEADALDASRMTAGGQISVDKKQLAGVDHPLARAVLEQRWVKRVADGYLDKIWGLAGYREDTSGIVHPSLWSMEARTHRMSASDPPVQQFPASDPTVRNAFLPRQEDHVLISADYGQIEMRNWAALNKDAALLQTLNEADRTGEDFFVLMARQLFGEPDFQKSDKRRGPIKNTSYATIYGGGVNKIAETAGVPVEQVQPIVMGLRQLYPSFADGGASMIEDLGDGKAQVTLDSGRQFRVRRYAEHYKLANYCVQGDSAEKLKWALIGCGAAGLADNAVLAVHDELIFSVPRAEAKDAAQTIKEIMDAQADPAKLGVAITASPVIGERWGALKD